MIVVLCKVNWITLFVYATKQKIQQTKVLFKTEKKYNRKAVLVGQFSEISESDFRDKKRLRNCLFLANQVVLYINSRCNLGSQSTNVNEIRTKNNSIFG